MKLGIDFHGVIDRAPDLFASLTRILRAEGWEIHIITGREACDELLQNLEMFCIKYQHLFSIISYHKSIGTHITYKGGDPTQPLIAPPKWDATKAEYCARVGIDIHVDDSEVYGRYFQNIPTQYIIFSETAEKFFKSMLWGAFKY